MTEETAPQLRLTYGYKKTTNGRRSPFGSFAAEIQAGDLKKELEEKRIELEHVRGEMEELQRQLDKANKDLEDLLKA